MTAESFAGRATSLLLDTSLKSLLLLVVASFVLLCLRRASASARHLVLLLTLFCLILLPFLSSTLSGWEVPLWPRTAALLPPGPITPETAVPGAAHTVTVSLSPAPSPPSIIPAAIPAVSAASAPAVSAVPSRFPWPLLMCGVWLIGVGVVLVPVLAGLICVNHLGRRARPVTADAVSALMAALARDLGVRRAVTLRQSEPETMSPVPMTWGWHRPVVLLPAGAVEWTADRLRVVLLHELAHIRRGDWLWQMVAHAVCAFYWFHPGVWLMARMLRIESERACDDQVLSAGVPPSDYARHLIAVARTLSTANALPRVALPMAGKSQVEGRLRSILRSSGGRAVSRRGAIAAVLMTAIVLVPVALLRLVPASAHPTTNPPQMPLPSVAAAKPASLYDNLPSSPRWTRRVSGTVGVELVGVTEGWGKATASWRPDGSRLAQPLYRRLDPQMQVQYPNKQMVREFALRLTYPTGTAVETLYQIPGSSSFDFTSGPAYSNGVQITDEHEFNSNTSGFRVVSAVLPKTLTRATVRVGVAAGSWREAASCGVEGNGGFSIANGDGSMDEVQFGKVFDSDGKHLLVVTDTYVKLDHRVVAIGTDGHIYDFHDQDIHNGQKFCVMTVKFDVPLKQIKEFRLQTRPYQWDEFKNVALEPDVPRRR